ncbi:MAG: GAF domain-containing protein [Fidelibacterota bacterium]|nr:MAG: GAF domain-containing protein [Candidatus Neomarinimicrobiota bacterium]
MANRKKNVKTFQANELPSLTDFFSLSQQILYQAIRSRPTVEFLIDISNTLISYTKCHSLELWLIDDGTCARWEATRSPKRFLRLADVSYDVAESLIQQGVVWTNDNLREQCEGISIEDRSFICFPLNVDDRIIGLLLLKSDQPDFFRESELPLLQHIAQTLAFAMTFQEVRLAQRERVKELTCLYDIAHIAAQTHRELQDILEDILRCIPSAWQYPDITEAQIVLDGKTYSTSGFGESYHQQKADIVVEGKPGGFVEIVYMEDRPEIDEGPFLVEERKLINTIAQEIAIVVQRKRAQAERITLQEQIRHADRLATIGHLAAGVAHELNEPLSGILGFSQLAMKHPDLPQQVLEDLTKIETESLQAREIIRKLLLFARQTSPAKNPVNLNHIVEEGVYFLEARCKKAGITLTLALQTGLPEITADPMQLRQVVVNLVVNAIQAMPEGGNLTITTAFQNESIWLVVSDTGEGMTEEVQERIFEPFFTTKDVGGGTGLGLPIVYGIVTAHRGEVVIHSQPGKGTRVEIELPLDGENEENQGE